MHSLADLVMAIPERFIVAATVGGIFFLIYFSLDIYLFLTRRNFGRVNIDLVYFTRNDNPSMRSSDAIHFRTIDGPVFLRSAYDNHFLFWRVIFRSARAKHTVVDFGKYTYAALVPFRDRVSAKCSVGEFKRALGFPFQQKKHRIVMVYDRSEDKRRFILKILVIQEEDLKNIADYLKNPPQTGKGFELFKNVAQIFQENPEAFLPVQVVAA